MLLWKKVPGKDGQTAINSDDPAVKISRCKSCWRGAMMMPFLIFADSKGKIRAHPYLRMTVCGINKPTVPLRKELIPLPKGSTFFYLPHRYPVGYDPVRQCTETLTDFQGEKVYAVAAFLIPGYLRLYNPCYVVEKEQILPLWAYTACGFYGGRWFVSASKVDLRIRQRPGFYDNRQIEKQAGSFIKKSPDNRLYRHLAHCALQYNCLAAKNLFLNRWEAPLPVAQTCNARCLGCLSWQDSDCTASHNRISFRPELSEIVEVMENHLRRAREPLVSFGQGCEGEPLTEAELIGKAIQEVRRRTRRGTIHMNTNASIPSRVEMLCRSGIDSFRVSLFSARPRSYEAYFRPRGYVLGDVFKSIKVMKKYKKFVAVNLLVYPGFTDREDEINALRRFISSSRVDMIQLRNLNIDPLLFSRHLSSGRKKGKGVFNLVKLLRREFPRLKLGYFNLPREKFSSFRSFLIK